MILCDRKSESNEIQMRYFMHFRIQFEVNLTTIKCFIISLKYIVKYIAQIVRKLTVTL